jgi:hypothetical protein
VSPGPGGTKPHVARHAGELGWDRAPCSGVGEGPRQGAVRRDARARGRVGSCAGALGAARRGEKGRKREREREGREAHLEDPNLAITVSKS